MTRVKRGTISLKRRRNVLQQVKGFRFGRRNKERLAREALKHAGQHAFAHRRDKKADRRRLWQVKISAALQPFEISYSKFAGLLKSKNIGVDRKILANLAQNNPETFERVVAEIKK